MYRSLATEDPSQLDSNEIFRHLPPNRCGEKDRQYMNQVLDDGFNNTKDAGNMNARLETAFAKKFGVGYSISHNSGS